VKGHDDDQPQAYEFAVLEKLRLDFAPVAVRVEGTEGPRKHYVMGRYSKVRRQLDAAVYDLDQATPSLVVDAKRFARRVHVKDVEAFIGLVDDVGAHVGALVAPMGFSKGAYRRAKAANSRIIVLSIEDALACEWLALARELYPHDWVFRVELAAGLRLLHEGAEPFTIADAIETVAFEEWECLVSHGCRRQRFSAVI
jgi:hypothetical protein